MSNNTYYVIIDIESCYLNVGGANVLLNDILYILQTRKNLLYVLALIEKGFEVPFVLGKMTIRKYDYVVFDGKYIKEYNIFKLKEINKTFDSTYIDSTLSSNIRHGINT